MRIPALVVLALFALADPVDAQIAPLAPIELSGPASPLASPAPYWLVEVDARHAGPELLVAQWFSPFQVWVLTLVVHDHPSRSGTQGSLNSPGICIETPIFTDIDFWSPFITFTAIDLNHDGRTDAVQFGDWIADIDTRIRPFMLGGLQHCQIPRLRR